MNVFHLTRNGEPQLDEVGRVGDMAETRQVNDIRSVILDESLSAIQQDLALSKAVSHHSIIENVNSAGLVVQSR